jgi:hypothetical protein
MPMTEQELRRQITNALFALGNTGDEVANTLRARHIKGMRKDPCLCPVAQYLRKHGFDNVRVDGRVQARHLAVHVRDIIPPAAVVDFMFRFDGHFTGQVSQYPDLELK